MSVRVLPEYEAAEFLARHPEITPDKIPSYGIKIEEYGKTYLIGLSRDGEIHVIDITYYDSAGRPVTLSEAQWKVYLLDVWKTLSPFSYEYSALSSSLGLPEYTDELYKKIKPLAIGGLILGLTIWTLPAITSIIRK